MTVLLGDIHFGKNGFSMETYENQMKFYHKQLFPFLLQQKINMLFVQVIFLIIEQDKMFYYY